MSGVVRIFLWSLLAVGLLVLVVVGFGIFQLSRIFPDVDQGRAMADEMSSELVAAHPAFTVETSVDSSFAEIGLTVRPKSGDLTEPEVTELVESLQAVVSEQDGSRWTVKSSISGRWDGTEVEITGSDADRWPELAPMLDLIDGSVRGVTLALDPGRGLITRDLGGELYCGPDADPQEFFARSVENAAEIATDLGWLEPEAPVLLYFSDGCDGSLRTSLDFAGDDRSGRVTELQAILDALPEEAAPVGITVQDTGGLQLAFDEEIPESVIADLVETWSHGEVWVNRSRVGEPTATG
ncbi:hypothetical protein FNH13_10790 [Ornithinimicrobium ciconiae]|uniref:Uncharacterized protein n=1 Tax=Ornithinimicrobium ciconiae TaxID=2594265 RepID=A0A516GB78_9MICO|nr:hypothetical protein [Ornithinimicrobium ciconiae]QDO88748.1 hypothetical protein FNH13_10790 [Ornithinimicrobium ciconiae]